MTHLNIHVPAPEVYYAIMHLASKRIMPEVHRGYTYWKPWKEDADRTSPIPRLFTTRRNAKIALSTYCKGECKVRLVDDFDILRTYNKTINHTKDDFRIIEVLVEYHSDETHTRT